MKNKSVVWLIVTLGFLAIVSGIGLYYTNGMNVFKVNRSGNMIQKEYEDSNTNIENDKNNANVNKNNGVSNKGSNNNSVSNNVDIEKSVSNDSVVISNKFNLSANEIKILTNNKFVNLEEIKNEDSTGDENIDILLRTANDFRYRNSNIDAYTEQRVKELVGYIKQKKLKFSIVGTKNVSIDIEKKYRDEGISCTINNEDCSGYVIVRDLVDYSYPGTYSIKYYLIIGDYAKTLTRTVKVTNAKGYLLTIGDPDPKTGNVGLYFRSTLPADKFKSITLPNGVEVTNSEFGYWAQDNGTYKFTLNKKDGTTKDKEVTIDNIDRISKTYEPAPAINYNFGTVEYTFNSNTLKYTVANTGAFLLSYIWVKDPYRQLGVALAGYPNPVGVNFVYDTMLNESSYFLGNKAFVATNASTFTSDQFNRNYYYGWYDTTESSYLINKGVVIHDFSTVHDRNHTKNLGIAKDGFLHDYAFSMVNYKEDPSETAKNIQRNVALVKKMNDDKIINSFTAFSTLVYRNGKLNMNTTVAPTARTAICQVDRNNFILLSSEVALDYPTMSQTFKTLGCYVAYNLDGGGSTQLVYKKADRTMINVLGNSRMVADALYFTE